MRGIGLTGFFLLLLHVVPALGGSLTEDFTTTNFMDPVHTTALWDTVSGELRLPPFELTSVGSCDTPGEACRVSAAGDMAFIADGPNGIVILDVTDTSATVPALSTATAAWWCSTYRIPPDPVPKGNCSVEGLSRDAVLAGDIAYMSLDTAGIRVFSILDRLVDRLSNRSQSLGLPVT